ncbi:MAG: energy-coupling factor transporter ATPase [Desulfitobacteriaceae bacterium]
MLISIKDVHFSYQPQAGGIVPALSGVNLEIEPGEFVVIVGHNGSGKSTLAKHLNVLNKPTSGDVWIGEMNTKTVEHLWPIRSYVGMVFQNPDNQIVSTVVEDDVAFGPENLGIEPSKIQEYVNESLEIMHLTDIRDSAPHMLSGGQKQRVAIAGVLAMRCKIIVLDEPTALLDPDSRKEVLDSLHRINREEKLTVILITHYMEEAIGADRMIVMDGGKIVLQGTPRQVFAQVDKIRALSLDVPMATQIAAELYARGYDVPPDCLSEEEVVDAICRLL